MSACRCFDSICGLRDCDTIRVVIYDYRMVRKTEVKTSEIVINDEVFVGTDSPLMIIEE